MANDNPTPNPDIVKIGEATRFGAGNDAKAAGSKSKVAAWSIRHQQRYLASQEVDIDDPNALKKLIGKKATIAQLMAMKAIQQALDGNIKASELVTDNIEGKLPTVNTVHMAAKEVEALDDDELRAAIAATEREIAAETANESGSEAKGNNIGSPEAHNED